VHEVDNEGRDGCRGGRTGKETGLYGVDARGAETGVSTERHGEFIDFSHRGSGYVVEGELSDTHPGRVAERLLPSVD
jgi:hypothetical protein